VLLDTPTIGCGKTRLLGEYQEVGSERGAYSLLIDKEEVIGAALRTQTAIKPVFVSIGHKVSLESACQWVLQLAAKFRLPQTTRLADQSVNKARKSELISSSTL
jgi:deoxyribonuclease V